MQSPALLQKICKFCTFLPNFRIFSPFSTFFCTFSEKSQSSPFFLEYGLLASVSVCKFTVLNYSFWVSYQTVFVFIMRIWVKDYHASHAKMRIGGCLPWRKFLDVSCVVVRSCGLWKSIKLDGWASNNSIVPVYSTANF